MNMKMKKYLFGVFSLFLFLMLQACFDVDKDELAQENQEKELIEKLKKNKWEFKWMDWNNTSYGGFYDVYNYRLYFMDDNIGYDYSVIKTQDTDLGSSKDVYFSEFTYNVSENVITTYDKQTGHQSTYVYSEGCLQNSSFDYYKPFPITQNDRELIKQMLKEQEEEMEEKELSDNIMNYVKVTDYFDKSSVTVEITINTQLMEKYEGKWFRYGIEWGYDKYEYSQYIDFSGKSHTVIVPVSEFYMMSYLGLREKIDSGEKLTENEQDLLKSIVKLIEKDALSFQARIFVEVDGKKYYVKEDIRAGQVSLSADWTPNVGEDNDGEGDDNISNSGDAEDGTNNSLIKVDYKNLTYIADGKTYKMILVDGGTLPAFYMMQTEVPILGYIQIGDTYIGSLDKNSDQYVIRSELTYFIGKLKDATGLDFRLPTEAEWKFAAKGGVKSKGYIYSGSDNVDDVAWYKGNCNGIQDIATKQPNELGFYDMSGNYEEVCSDIPDYIDGRTYGGCWKYTASNCTPTSWNEGNSSADYVPGTKLREKSLIDGRYITVRLVYSVPQ